MDLHNAHWGKTFFWGIVTGVLYALMFSYSGELLHLAHTTPDACVTVFDGHASYQHRQAADACTAGGGTPTPGTWWHVLVPILLAFIISYAHGVFTGLFWDSMGLKAASAQTRH